MCTWQIVYFLAVLPSIFSITSLMNILDVFQCFSKKNAQIIYHLKFIKGRCRISPFSLSLEGNSSLFLQEE
jgi:hypothetical protein